MSLNHLKVSQSSTYSVVRFPSIPVVYPIVAYTILSSWCRPHSPCGHLHGGVAKHSQASILDCEGSHGKWGFTPIKKLESGDMVIQLRMENHGIIWNPMAWCFLCPCAPLKKTSSCVAGSSLLQELCKHCPRSTACLVPRDCSARNWCCGMLRCIRLMTLKTMLVQSVLLIGTWHTWNA